ncbi:hypothetical protein [Glutamicibacter sp. NPDC087344]|uniref:hypothetical protein n=1 Tax=Glutamicibacter sp. NPDC087344 TaxID=3363994 RepID=UPI00381330CF
MTTISVLPLRACLVALMVVLPGISMPDSVPSGLKEICPESVYDVNFTKNFGESLRKDCLSKLQQITDSPEFDRIVDRETRPKFRIEYDNSCPIGLENANGCDSNPDARRCDDGTIPYLMIIRYSEGENEGQIFSSRLVCPEDDVDVPDDVVREVIVTPEHFRRFPILGSELHSDPYQFSLRNGHSHMWADANDQTFSDNIDGSPVTIKAIPVEWRWNYGDGVTANLDFPGDPVVGHTLHDETSTSHSYTETGTFTVTVTTIYRGEFRVGNGPWQTIGGQAAVPSDPITMDVWRTKKELIAND